PRRRSLQCENRVGMSCLRQGVADQIPAHPKRIRLPALCRTRTAPAGAFRRARKQKGPSLVGAGGRSRERQNELVLPQVPGTVFEHLQCPAAGLWLPQMWQASSKSTTIPCSGPPERSRLAGRKGSHNGNTRTMALSQVWSHLSRHL